MTSRRPDNTTPDNTTPDNTGNPDSRDALFDQTARIRYTDALGHLSPAVRVRLQQARHAASQAARRPTRRRHTLAWVGSAAVLSLIVGLQLRHAPVDQPPATPLTVAQADQHPVDNQTAIDDGEVTSMLAALDENPDFYLWLAANDSALPPPSER